MNKKQLVGAGAASVVLLMSIVCGGCGGGAASAMGNPAGLTSHVGPVSTPPPIMGGAPPPPQPPSSGTAPLPTQPPGTGTAAPTPQPTSGSASVVVITDTISGLSGNSFTLRCPSDAGCIPVTVTDSTRYVPDASVLRNGSVVKVTGIGWPYVTATEIDQAASTPASAPTIAPIVTPSAAPVATPLPLPVSGIPTHVLNVARLGGLYGAQDPGPGLPWSQYAPYVTIADNPATNNGSAIAAAGMLTTLYTDPARQFSSGDTLYANAIEADFAHTCSGARIKTTGNQYLMDPHSAHLATIWKNLIESYTRYEHVDYVFADDFSFVDYMDGTPCNFSQADWNRASAVLIAGVSPHSVEAGSIIQGVGGLPLSAASFNIGVDQQGVANQWGSMAENCYSLGWAYHGQGNSTDDYWLGNENTEIRMRQLGKRYVCYGNGLGDRIFYYASFMATYSLNLTFAQPQGFNSAKMFKVFPEEQIVATNPVVPDSSINTVTDIQNASGAYVREYRDCYYSGARFGRCAAIINPSSTGTVGYPIALTYSYRHTVTLAGDGVLDGGTASLGGPPPPAQLGPATAVIAIE